MDWQHKFVSPVLIPVILDHERYRGYVLDREDHEIPITDDMVLRACEALEYVKYPYREPIGERARSRGA